MKTLAGARDKIDLLHRLRSVQRDSVPRWGRMSAHQMVCHLADAFRMATGETVPRFDSKLPLQSTLKWVALYVPLRWPPGIMTIPEVDQERDGTKPADFAADVEQLETLLDAFTAARSFDRRPHPLFGRMSDADWLRWGYLHMDHHLRQFGA